MNILIVTTQLPYPPESGGTIRVHGLVEGIKQAGHNATLLCFHDKEVSDLDFRVETVLPPIRTRTDRLYDLMVTRQPDIARRLFSETFAARLRALLTEERFDLVQFEGIESVCYLPIAKQAAPDSKMVFDTFNAEFALQRNIYEIDSKKVNRWPAAMYSYLQIGRIKRYERKMCQLADGVIAVSGEDAAVLKQFRSDQHIHIVPNGIWVDRYKIRADNINLPEHTLVFTGKMDYRPNVDAMIWFTSEIFPDIQQCIPDVQLYIVGQHPHARLQPLSDNPKITLTGRVDSVVPYLHAAAVYVAPLRMGSGTRLKLLEAMATGCAIVATSTASTGLHPEVRRVMKIKDQPNEIAKTINHLLQHPSNHADLSQSAQTQVRKYYDWSTLIPRLLSAYEEIGLG